MPDGGAGIAIHGLAVAEYPGGAIYRFSCDRDWEVQNDAGFDSIQQALHALSGQYAIERIVWTSRDT